MENKNEKSEKPPLNQTRKTRSTKIKTKDSKLSLIADIEELIRYMLSIENNIEKKKRYIYEKLISRAFDLLGVCTKFNRYSIYDKEERSKRKEFQIEALGIFQSLSISVTIAFDHRIFGHKTHYLIYDYMAKIMNKLDGLINSDKERIKNLK